MDIKSNDVALCVCVNVVPTVCVTAFVGEASQTINVPPATNYSFTFKPVQTCISNQYTRSYQLVKLITPFDGKGLHPPWAIPKDTTDSVEVLFQASITDLCPCVCELLVITLAVSRLV